MTGDLLERVNDVLVAHVDEGELDFIVQTLRQRLWLGQVGEHLEFGVTLRFEHEFALAINPFGRLDVDRERGPGQVVDGDQRVRLIFAEHQKSVRTVRRRECIEFGSLGLNLGVLAGQKMATELTLSAVPWAGSTGRACGHCRSSCRDLDLKQFCRVSYLQIELESKPRNNNYLEKFVLLFFSAEISCKTELFSRLDSLFPEFPSQTIIDF